MSTITPGGEAAISQNKKGKVETLHNKFSPEPQELKHTKEQQRLLFENMLQEPKALKPFPTYSISAADTFLDVFPTIWNISIIKREAERKLHEFKDSSEELQPLGNKWYSSALKKN